jgi:hypothetical protein
MTFTRGCRACGVAFAIALCALSAPAQSLRETVTDSVLVDFASIATFKIIAGYAAQASQGVRRVWIIAIPGGLAGWDSLAGHLSVALRARDTSSADMSRMTLTVRPPRVVGDTLIEFITVSGLFRCRVTDTVWRESGSTFEIRVQRSTGSSFSPEIKQVSAIDSVGCGARK